MRGKMKPAVLAVVLLVATLSGCGGHAARCNPFTKGFPLCGI